MEEISARIVRNNNWYEPGMVAADNLSPQKAAILLALALTKTSDPMRFSACSTNIERRYSGASTMGS